MLRLLILITLLVHSLNGFSQIFKRYNPYPEPGIILVKLPTYTKRLRAYEQANNTTYATQIKKDANAIQQLMIADFKNYFSYCNYYFFYDTASEAIGSGKFDGNLFDKDMKQLTTSPIKAGDTTYQIVHFGYYVSEQTEVTSNPNNNAGRENTYYTGLNSQRLVVMNYKFGRLPDPLPNGTMYYKPPTLNLFSSGWGKKKKYPKSAYYTSKKLDLYYYPSAYYLSKQMDRYYRQHRVD